MMLSSMVAVEHQLPPPLWIAAFYLLLGPNSIASCTTVLFPLCEKVTPSSVWLSLSGKPKIGGGMASAGATARVTADRIPVNSISLKHAPQAPIISCDHIAAATLTVTQPLYSSHLVADPAGNRRHHGPASWQQEKQFRNTASM